LPALYDPSVFTEEERNRFFAALNDGFFGQRFDPANLDEVALPARVEAGLLKHRAFYDWTASTESRSDDKTEEFWVDRDDTEEPGLFRLCPINFEFHLIESYFLKQKADFFEYVMTTDEYKQELETGKFSVDDDDERLDTKFYDRVLDKTYSKTWYEYHINQQLSLIKDSLGAVSRLHGPDQLEEVAFITTTSAKFGRLIEQYYWKFIVEKAAIRGDKVSKAAQYGGHLRASKQKQVHAGWNSAARAVWQENPTSSKMTVASIIKKRLKLAPSAKHISRVLTRS